MNKLSPIAGSKYYRAFCYYCGDPIRVVYPEKRQPEYYRCDRCGGRQMAPKGAGLTHRQKCKLKLTNS
jgi:hypothetical protein